MRQPAAERYTTTWGSVLHEIRHRLGGRARRFSGRAALKNAKRLGFAPATVIDVGAGRGTPYLHDAYPHAHFLLVEPLQEFQACLSKLAAGSADGRIKYAIAAATAEPNEITLHVHPDLFGSSAYLEDEDSEVNGVPRQVPGIPLNQLVKQHSLPGPYLMKVDVQGAEMEVIKGASELLAHTEYIILEVSLHDVFVGGPVLHDIVAFMKERGFVAYDMFGNSYRLLDDALNQVDIAFVKQDGMFRRHNNFASAAQRAAKNRRSRLIRKIRQVLPI